MPILIASCVIAIVISILTLVLRVTLAIEAADRTVIGNDASWPSP